MLRAVGVDQAGELAATGSAYVVVEVDIRYHRPARLAEDVVVVSTVDEVRAASVRIHQRVMRGPELLTDARVTAAFLDRQGRPRRHPQQWVEKFRKLASPA
jgi:acyl-CoA thioester hydrolase